MTPTPKLTKKGRRKLCRDSVRNRQIGTVVAAVITAAAEDVGCTPAEIYSLNRGEPRAARGRVVAMKVCVMLGLSYGKIARAFRRTKRNVHEAIRIGRPGYEARDADVEVRWRRVLAVVEAQNEAQNLPDLSRIGKS